MNKNCPFKDQVCSPECELSLNLKCAIKIIAENLQKIAQPKS